MILCIQMFYGCFIVIKSKKKSCKALDQSQLIEKINEGKIMFDVILKDIEENRLYLYVVYCIILFLNLQQIAIHFQKNVS